MTGREPRTDAEWDAWEARRRAVRAFRADTTFDGEERPHYITTRIENRRMRLVRDEDT